MRTLGHSILFYWLPSGWGFFFFSNILFYLLLVHFSISFQSLLILLYRYSNRINYFIKGQKHPIDACIVHTSELDLVTSFYSSLELKLAGSMYPPRPRESAHLHIPQKDSRSSHGKTSSGGVSPYLRTVYHRNSAHPRTFLVSLNQWFSFSKGV